MYVLSNPRRLAKLLTSIKVTKPDRPLTPVETAKEIEAMLHDLNGDKNELVKRLPISADIIKQFLGLLNLPPEIQDIVIWGESKKETGSIGFSVAAKISRFDNQNDMLKVASAVLGMDRPVTKEEVKAVLSLKKHNSEKPIDECVTEVLNVTRPLIIQHFMFISGLRPDIIDRLKTESSISDQDIHEFARHLLCRFIPNDSLKGLKVFRDCIRLSLTKQGKDHLDEYSTSNDLSRQEIINHMFDSSWR